MSTFKERLEEALRLRNMTPADLSRASGITEGAISQYRKGEYKATQRSLEKLSKALRVEIAWLMGADTPMETSSLPALGQVTLAEDVVTFRVHTDIAAGYDQPAEPVSDWEGATIEIPSSFLRGRPQSDYFLIRVVGNSMYPHYQNGDYVLVLRQETITRSGEIAVLLYNGGEGTLKKIEYGDNCIKLIPLNPEYAPKTIAGSDMELCRIIGVPRMIIRDLGE